MYSHYRKSERLGVFLAVIAAIGLLIAGQAAVAAAQTNNSWFGNSQLPYQPQSQVAPSSVAVSQIFPGEGSPPPEDPIARHYQGKPGFINEGHRLFLWYNCVGCHSNGGGGMGPGFLDNQ
jgi:mono/diheme cytochrome c family protein